MHSDARVVVVELSGRYSKVLYFFVFWPICRRNASVEVGAPCPIHVRIRDHPATTRPHPDMRACAATPPALPLLYMYRAGTLSMTLNTSAFAAYVRVAPPRSRGLARS